MTTCCHCGRTLTYKSSIDNGCGRWCLDHKGFCDVENDYDINQHRKRQESLAKNIAKGLVKGIIIGAALTVTCVFLHAACIITAFLNDHNYLKSSALSIYSAIKNYTDHEKHPIGEALLTEAMETSNSTFVNTLSSTIGTKFIEIIGGRQGISNVWAYKIGKETVKSMIEQVSGAVFEWESKAVV